LLRTASHIIPEPCPFAKRHVVHGTDFTGFLFQGTEMPEGSVMDYYATALIEVVVDLFFWLRAKFKQKPSAKGRPSVPSVQPRQA
jgi:hypothetical protein